MSNKMPIYAIDRDEALEWIELTDPDVPALDRVAAANALLDIENAGYEAYLTTVDELDDVAFCALPEGIQKHYRDVMKHVDQCRDEWLAKSYET